MKTGFTFNGIHSSKFGIVMLTKSRTVIPEAKQYSYSALAADGSYDFTEANSKKRAVYNNRTFQLTMQIRAENIFRLHERINGICSWLTGRGELIFDDIPDSVWSARVINSVDFAPENSGCKAVLNIVFDAEPFAYAQFDTQTGPLIGNSLHIGSNLPLELDGDFVFTLPKGETGGSFEITNIGTWYVSPAIIIETEKAANISLECGGKVLEISEAYGGYIKIDTEQCTAKNRDGDSLIGCINGDFPELAPGRNTFTLLGERKFKSEVKVTVIYTPKFLYTADFENAGEVGNA